MKEDVEGVGWRGQAVLCNLCSTVKRLWKAGGSMERISTAVKNSQYCKEDLCWRIIRMSHAGGKMEREIDAVQTLQ